MRLTIVLALYLAMLCFLPAVAQDQSEYPPEAIFKAWDRDGDGLLTKTEWTDAGRQERGFLYVDADQDGKVTLEELKAAMAKRADANPPK